MRIFIYIVLLTGLVQLASCSNSELPPKMQSSLMQSSFGSMQMCLVGVPINAESNVSQIFVDKPTIVRGQLKNGTMFSCVRRETGTKGVHFVGIFEYIKPYVSTSEELPAVSTISDRTSNSSWADHQICGAVVETYFFMKDTPSFVGENAGTYAYLTQFGEYSCKLTGEGHTYLSWINKSGQSMKSVSTKYSFESDTLKVRSDMDSIDFQLLGETWKPLDN